jgi:transposase
MTNSILGCETCGILWKRDVNASKNMFDISNPVFKNKGRPEDFTRKIAVEETGSSSEI